jgi:Antibiotic biosynthesis monooxygenase
VIIRVFRPTIHPGKEREFEAFLRDTAVPLVSQQAGLVAQHVGKPRDPSSTEYVYVTVWEDVESVRGRTGPILGYRPGHPVKSRRLTSDDEFRWTLLVAALLPDFYRTAPHGPGQPSRFAPISTPFPQVSPHEPGPTPTPPDSVWQAIGLP